MAMKRLKKFFKRAGQQLTGKAKKKELRREEQAALAPQLRAKEGLIQQQQAEQTQQTGNIINRNIAGSPTAQRLNVGLQAEQGREMADVQQGIAGTQREYRGAKRKLKSNRLKKGISTAATIFGL